MSKCVDRRINALKTCVEYSKAQLSALHEKLVLKPNQRIKSQFLHSCPFMHDAKQSQKILIICLPSEDKCVWFHPFCSCSDFGPNAKLLKGLKYLIMMLFCRHTLYPQKDFQIDSLTLWVQTVFLENAYENLESVYHRTSIWY